MKICCIGDSLTEGDYGVYGIAKANVQPENYPYFLAKLTDAEVINYGKCGFAAMNMLHYYNAGNVDVTRADWIIIMLGTNGGNDPDRETPNNRAYREIIAKCRMEAPAAQIVLCTPPHATSDPTKPHFGHAEDVKRAQLFVRNLAAAEGLKLVDFAKCEAFTAENEEVMQPNDGLHFGKLGYQTMAEYIFNTIFAGQL